MNTDQITGKFDQIKGKIKEKWGRLTHDDIVLYNGQRDQFFGRLQERYGLAKQKAQKQARRIEKSCGHDKIDAA